MAKRYVNQMIGRSAGVGGLDGFMMWLLFVAMISGGVAHAVTKNFLLAGIVATGSGFLFYLVTNGKPGEFINSWFRRPNWVRSERRYINEWSYSYRPRRKRVGVGVSWPKMTLSTILFFGIFYANRSTFIYAWLVYPLLMINWRNAWKWGRNQLRMMF